MNDTKNWAIERSCRWSKSHDKRALLLSVNKMCNARARMKLFYQQNSVRWNPIWSNPTLNNPLNTFKFHYFGFPAELCICWKYIADHQLFFGDILKVSLTLFRSFLFRGIFMPLSSAFKSFYFCVTHLFICAFVLRWKIMVKGWRKRKNDYINIKLDSIVSFRDRFMHYEKCEMQIKLLEETISIKVSFTLCTEMLWWLFFYLFKLNSDS